MNFEAALYFWQELLVGRELENVTSVIDIISKGLKMPIAAANQLDIYEGPAALTDQKSLKAAAIGRHKSFATEGRYEAFKTVGAYEFF